MAPPTSSSEAVAVHAESSSSAPFGVIGPPRRGSVPSNGAGRSRKLAYGMRYSYHACSSTICVLACVWVVFVPVSNYAMHTYYATFAFCTGNGNFSTYHPSQEGYAGCEFTPDRPEPFFVPHSTAMRNPSDPGYFFLSLPFISPSPPPLPTFGCVYFLNVYF